MGIYINGIDMPKQDELLQIRAYGDGKVSRVYDIWFCMNVAQRTLADDYNWCLRWATDKARWESEVDK